MIQYLVLAVLSLFTLVEGSTRTLAQKKYSSGLAVAAIVLIALAGLRGSGTDDPQYREIFQSVPYLDAFLSTDLSSIHGEYLFLLANSFFKTLGFGVEAVFLFIATIAVCANLFVFRKTSPLIWGSLLVYFAHSFQLKELIQIRAGLASALVLLAIYFLSKEKEKRFLVIVLVASQIHSAAYVAFLPFLIGKTNLFNRQTGLLSLLVAVCVGAFGVAKPILGFLETLVGIPSSLAVYMNWTTYNYSLGLLNPVTLKQTLVCLFCLMYFEPLRRRFVWFEDFMLFYLFGTAWLLVFSDFAIFSARIATIVSVSEMVLLPALGSLVTKRDRGVFSVALVAYSFLALYLNLLNPNVKPYTFAYW